MPSKTHDEHTSAPAVAVLAVALVAVAAGASGVLAYQHLTGIRLPGCGTDSACAALTSGKWGRLPGIGWPTAYVGVAYFLSLLAALRFGDGRRSAGLRWIMRVGVLVSVGFVVLMAALGKWCPWCLTVHVANLAAWLLLELRVRPTRAAGRSLTVLAGVFVVATGGLAIGEGYVRHTAHARAERELAASVRAMTREATSMSQPAPATAPSETSVAVTDTPDAPAGAGFTGRYRLGPEVAAIRIVMFGDYQCTSCRQIERQAMMLVRHRQDISLSFKHFPLCTGCNPMAKVNVHPNACWAARAAETAGILHGNDGFWQMHRWLFDHAGAFTRAELRPALQQFGYDVAEFERTMQSDETLDLVRADVDEGLALAIYQTPTIYINGVELHGWEAPNALRRAVDELAATHPQPATAAADHPIGGIDKLFADWRAQPRVDIPPTPPDRTMGPANAPVRVVVFAELLQDGFGDADAVIRQMVATRGDVRYELRYLPFDRACNPVVRVKSPFENGCLAARAAEAAGLLGGAESCWAAVDWIHAQRASFSAQSLDALGQAIGMEPRQLMQQANSPDARAAVAADTALAARLKLSRVPSVFINGHLVPRWKLGEQNVLEQFIKQAADGGG